MVPDSGSPLPPAATTPHRHAPNPQPFAPDQIARWYLSDLPARGPFYYPIVSGFERLRQDHPEVLADNLEQAVTLNNSAVKDPIRVQRALADDHDDLLVTMSDAWGTELSGHFRQALAQHRLPQVEQLLSGVVARGGGIASSTGQKNTGLITRVSLSSHPIALFACIVRVQMMSIPPRRLSPPDIRRRRPGKARCWPI